MNPLLMLLGLRLVATVDRIEGHWAVVEWPSGELGDLPRDLLPRGLREGDRVVVRLAPCAAHGRVARVEPQAARFTGLVLANHPTRLATSGGVVAVFTGTSLRPGGTCCFRVHLTGHDPGQHPEPEPAAFTTALIHGHAGHAQPRSSRPHQPRLWREGVPHEQRRTDPSP